jgi:hypothetical protein
MRRRFVGAAILLALAAGGRAGPDDRGTPLRWGFDDIGVRRVDCRNEGCLVSHPRAEELIREFRFDLWVTWYPDAAPSWSRDANRAYIRRLDALAAGNGLHWIVNPLSPLWDSSPAGAVDAEGTTGTGGGRTALLPLPGRAARGARAL